MGQFPPRLEAAARKVAEQILYLRRCKAERAEAELTVEDAIRHLCNLEADLAAVRADLEAERGKS